MIVPILYVFLTSWLIEARFYATNDVLTKKGNLLQTEKRGDLRLNQNQGLEDQFDKPEDTRSSEVISQDLYFVFVNRMHFL